jgi:hypothetical protein
VERLPAPFAASSRPLALAALALVAALGCSSTDPPEPAPFPTAAEAAAAARAAGAEDAGPADSADPTDSTEAAESADSGTGEGRDTGRDGESSVIMIERGDGPRKPTLWEAARSAREGRENAPPPVASVTNENLHEYQDVELTFVVPSEEDDGGADESGSETGSAGDDDREDADRLAGRGEEYWRDRVLDARLRLRQAVDEVEELERDAASLRRSFYAEDDPYIRDGRIKEAWDRATGRLETARREVERLRDELSETLQEGRRDGALPGWLREGIELEPSFEEDEPAREERDQGDLPIHRAEEPSTVEPDEPPGNDRP